MNSFLTNKTKIVFFALAIGLLIVTISNCKKETNANRGVTPLWIGDLEVPAYPYNYENPNLPNYFYDPFVIVTDNTPLHNPTTNWGATLGRVLFYDKRLSKNYTISCSSCHIQEFGFSDTARFSKGFNHGKTARHSMGIANARYYASGKFFWDERASTLEEQVFMPIQDPVEMGMTIDSLVARLSAVDYYPQLFELAFGEPTIDSVEISRALAQFVRSIVSYRSKYDEGRKNSKSPSDKFSNFTASENRGKAIFNNSGQLSCSGCHNTDLFIGDNPRNNGMPLSSDSGVGKITLNPVDLFTFKAPSLKNIAVRPPYMHKGQFSSLEQVINHYSEGIAEHAYLDPHFRKGDGGILQFNLSAREKIDLLNFLKTLTDDKLLNDQKFSDPFNK